MLRNLADLHAKDPAKVLKYAEQLTHGVRQSEWVEAAADDPAPFTLAELEAMYRPWQAHFDRVEGGMNRAPKFPLPNNWQFLLRYWNAGGDASALAQVRLTLDKMAFGGIYDHLGGGFARYSTDGLWKVPHFEKMLYDNGQLLELYAEAFQATGDPLYARVVRETAGFVARELTSPGRRLLLGPGRGQRRGRGEVSTSGPRKRSKPILGDDFPLFRDAYNVNSVGYWEEGNYIPLRKRARCRPGRRGRGLDEAEHSPCAWKRPARPCSAVRDKRVRPGPRRQDPDFLERPDVQGLLAAYRALGDPAYLDAAERNLAFMLDEGPPPRRRPVPHLQGRAASPSTASWRTTPSWPRPWPPCTRPPSTENGSRPRAN